MSLEELDRLRAFLEKDDWINSLADFQRVTGVSDSLLKEISPYFKFPDWVNKIKTLSKEKGEDRPGFNSQKGYKSGYRYRFKMCLWNWRSISHRIIKYRESLGGFFQ